MASPVPTTPGALADTATFKRRFPVITENVDAITLQEVLVEATSHLEDRSSRRLAPFYNTLYEDRLEGIDPNEYGDSGPGIPMSFQGSMGLSYAASLGANDLVRHFWLPEYAPTYPELWTYDIQSIELFLTYGNSQSILVDPPSQGLIGDSPSVTDGHVWLQLGIFCPEGTRVKVVYSGGYTLGIPPSLQRCCLYQAAKFLILESGPQQRKGDDLKDIDQQIDYLIAPWMRA